MVEFNLHSILMLKGPALSVFTLLLMCAEPVSQAWLERNSGYSDKPVHSACLLLKELGLAYWTLDGWLLAGDVELPENLRRNSGAISSINALDLKDLKELKDLKDLKISNTNTKRPGKNSGPKKGAASPQGSDAASKAKSTAEMWQMLSEAGIYHNDRTRDLLKLPHITPQYLRDKLDEYKNHARTGPRFTGVLIRALEEGEPVEARGANGHLVSCQCNSCTLRRVMGR